MKVGSASKDRLLGGSFGFPMFLIRLEIRQWIKKRMEDILVSNSSLVSGLSEASGVKFSWAEASQESPKKSKTNRETSAY